MRDVGADILRGPSEVLLQAGVLRDSAVDSPSLAGVPGIATQLVGIKDGYVVTHEDLVLVLDYVEGLQVEVHAVLGEAVESGGVPHREERPLGKGGRLQPQP